MTWQTIETAPKDGTAVDLWMVDQDGMQWRETDAYYVTGGDDEQPVWIESAACFGRPLTIKRDGWWAPNHDYDGQDGWCDEPERFNPHPRQNRAFFKKPTHWMPFPAPPEL